MKRTRLWLILGGLLVVVVVLSIVMQAINSLIWQLSYWLPGWLVGPILLLLVGALVLALLVEPLIRGKRGQPSQGNPRHRVTARKQPAATSTPSISNWRNSAMTWRAKPCNNSASRCRSRWNG